MLRGSVKLEQPIDVEVALAGTDYIADEGLATAIFIAIKLGKPLLLEGNPGVGKTEAAKSIAAFTGRELIRLQCYEGIDASQALCDWNYPRQLLAIRKAGEQDVDVYQESFLIERPLLKALRMSEGAVLLIDEIDRSDHEFEAFLLEFLSEFQITVPEIGTLTAKKPPIVILTSNRSRDLHSALRRRCIHHWIAYPDADREAAIIARRAGGVTKSTAMAVAHAVQGLRQLPLVKAPGISEAVDWAQSATLIKGSSPWPVAFRRAVGAVIKEEEDMARVNSEIEPLLVEAFASNDRTPS